MNNIFSTHSDNSTRLGESEPSRCSIVAARTLQYLLAMAVQFPVVAGAAASGAAILKSSGHQGYDPTMSTVNAVVGCAILDATLMPVTIGIEAACKKTFLPIKGQLINLFLGLALSAAYGALGSAVLESSMPADKSAAASVVGVCILGVAMTAIIYLFGFFAVAAEEVAEESERLFRL